MSPSPVKLPQGTKTIGTAEQITKCIRGWAIDTQTKFNFLVFYQDLQLEVDIKLQSHNRFKFRQVAASEPESTSNSNKADRDCFKYLTSLLAFTKLKSVLLPNRQQPHLPSADYSRENVPLIK